jgi:hypothetical protein
MRCLLPLLIVLAGCPEELPDDPPPECDVVGEARMLDGWEPAHIGPLSDPKAGDAYLANDRVQVVIQGPGRDIAVNPWGGNIIDADVRRDDGTMRDLFGEVAAFINLAGTGSADSVSVVSDGSCGEPAQVKSEGTYVLSDYVNLTTGVDIVLPGALDGVDVDAPHPLRIESTYTARPGEDFVRVALTATNEGDTSVPFLLAWLAEAGLTRGFLPTEQGWDLSAFGAAEYLVFAGEGVAYGLLPLPDERVPARGYVSFVGAYALAQDRTALDIFGYPDSAHILAPGRSITSELAFVIGATHADVVRTLQGILGEPCTTVSGVLSEDGAGPIEGAFVSAFAVEGGVDGVDLARDTTDADGAWSLCLPSGPARLIAGQSGRPYFGGGTEPGRVDITVADAPLDVLLSLPPTGRITATITATDGSPLPSRLTIYGVDPSPHSYRLDGDGFDPNPPGVVRMVDSADGVFELQIEPGEYQAVFTRGPEYSMHTAAVTVGSDAASLTGTLHHVVDTAGHLSGDFHVHAQSSPDSQILDADRARNMAAEGVEILVSTDHAHVTDYGPVVDDLGLSSWLATVPGQEITTFDYGHFNAFPLVHVPDLHSGGAFDWPGLSPDAIGAALTDEGRIFQVNHPRAVPAPGEGSYFNNVDLQFDDEGPYVGSDARDPLAVRLAANAQMLTSNFVAMEVMTWLDVQGLADWFNFQNAGLSFTATANSDTHTVNVESSGWPRNYVRLDTDDPTALTEEDLVLALQRGRNTLSFGPFVTLMADGADVGDTLIADGEVTATVRVQAPTWIPFDRVELIDGSTNTVLAGGSVTPSVVAAGGGERLEWTVEHAFTPSADLWLTVVVSGSQGLFPGVPYNTSDRATLTLEAVRAGDVQGPATAFAMTNALFIDGDGDGQITPSHLVLPQDFASWRWEDRTNPY